ncbi:hypothetical protein, partial [Klebsiella pneumoniae]|uniref:phenylalanine--tRNA ligase subunit beta-related protein n=1 Tax=Klebsiella pneumoniae TaxID=573 RepID=UPI00272EFD8B
MAAITAAGGALLRSARLFDVFKPAAGTSTDLQADERSLAVRLELLDDEATLTDERIEAVVTAIVTATAQQLGARLRG